jgi:hypothetical protein
MALGSTQPLNRNEYQEYDRGNKEGVHNFTRSVATAVATDLGHPYWIYIIPTYGMHQWLLLQFLLLLMMDAESV